MRKSKGVELPVNVLVIIAIAVIVLLGLIVLLSFGTAGANPILLYLDKGPACQQYNCGQGGDANVIAINRDLDASGDKSLGTTDKGDNLAYLCIAAGQCKSGTQFDEDQVKTWCGCQLPATASVPTP